jgi:hypothetical protein
MQHCHDLTNGAMSLLSRAVSTRSRTLSTGASVPFAKAISSAAAPRSGLMLHFDTAK